MYFESKNNVLHMSNFKLSTRKIFKYVNICEAVFPKYKCTNKSLLFVTNLKLAERAFQPN